MTDDVFRDPHRVRVSSETYGEMAARAAQPRDTTELPPRTGDMLVPPTGAFDPETTPEVGDPMQLLGEGMRPLPEGTDMDRLIAAYDLIGRMGMANFEVGYDDTLPTDKQWYATCMTGNGEVFHVDRRGFPEGAAEALARKLANGGRCTHCGKVTSLNVSSHDLSGVAGMSQPYCYWHREGKQWVRGCTETHHDREATKDAINEYIDRTNSPAKREV